MSTYAYIPGKNEKLREAFNKMGISDKNIFEDEWESGNGAAYKRLLRRLKKGDMIYIQNLDALGIGMRDICSQWRSLTKDRGVDVVVLNSPLIDTRRGKELNGSLVADVVTEILSYAAHDEHDRKLMRQKDGIERAKERGVHCGRTARQLPENFDEMCRMWKRGEIPAMEAARRCNMAVSTFRYHAKKVSSD